MKKIPLICFTLLLLVASAALSQQTDYTVDYSADFSKFKTFKWLAIETTGAIDYLTMEQIKTVIETALTRKGLKRTDAESADLLINYQSRETIRDRISIDPVPGASPVTDYHGDLTINMYTPAKRNLVWRGTASKALDPKANPEKRQKNLKKAVAKVMKNYPPQIGTPTHVVTSALDTAIGRRVPKSMKG